MSADMDQHRAAARSQATELESGLRERALLKTGGETRVHDSDGAWPGAGLGPTHGSKGNRIEQLCSELVDCISVLAGGRHGTNEVGITLRHAVLPLTAVQLRSSVDGLVVELRTGSAEAFRRISRTSGALQARLRRATAMDVVVSVEFDG